MTTSQKKRLSFVVILILLSIVWIAPTFLKGKLPNWWPAKAIRLGLDLKGGSYLVLGVQTEEAVKSQLVTIASTIKSELRKEKIRVIRAKQVGERSVELVLLGNDKLDELDAYMRREYPELKKADSQPSERRVRVTYEMREQKALEVQRNSVDQAIETIRNRVDQYGVAEPTIQRSGETHIIVQLPDITDVDSVKKTIGSVAKLDFRLVVDPRAGTLETPPITLKRRDGGIERVEDNILMTGSLIDTAVVEINPGTNEIEVVLRLNPVGGKTFERITADNVGRQLAIILDGVVQSAPVIRERIGGGSAQITGGFTPDEAHRLAIVLRSGALPAPLNFLEERTVGASLGADSIRKGLISMLVGSALVMLFTVVYYRKAGVLAVFCLLLNFGFLLALLSLLGATLTLPGIAGLILTVGMAVDANVIIFERIREELRAGSTAKAASEAGFLKAHWTILDANITTLLTGLVLYGFGTGPIKGFAVTLCLGIITSVFSALFIGRLGFEVFKLRNRDGSLSI